MNRRASHPAARAVPPQMLILDEVATRLHLSARSVRRLIKVGALPVHRFGTAVRISTDDLERYIAGSRHGQ